MITILGANGVTQAEIAALMGKTTQGRLSEYKMHKRAPTWLMNVQVSLALP